MSKLYRSIVIVCLIVLVAIALLFSLLPHIDAGNHKLTKLENPQALYEDATTELSTQPNIQLLINAQEIISTNENTFETSAQRIVTHLNQGSDSWQLYAEENISMAPHSIETVTYYSDNTILYSLNGTHFTGECTPEALLSQYPSAVILDPKLYSNISGVQVGNSNVIFFSEPKEAENWFSCEPDQFLGAWGCAWINKNGELVKSTYQYSYAQNETTFYKAITVQVTDPAPSSIPTPADTVDCLNLEDPLLPMQLEIACGYLLQAGTITSAYSDRIVCEIFGDTRIQNIDITVDGHSGKPAIEMTTAVDITNNSRQGEVISSKQTQKYKSGIYTLRTNNDPEVTTQNASHHSLLTSCQEILIGTILLPQDVKNATISDTGSSYRVEFGATDAFAQKVISDVCTTLYNDPLLLDQISTEHRIDNVMCYIELSKKTMFPLKSGIHFNGTYYSSELPYQLIFESDQTYFIP